MKTDLPPGQQRIFDAVAESPDITARQVHRTTGIAETYVRRVLNRFVRDGLIHVSGYDESHKRRKPKLYTAGPTKGYALKYPYVPLEQQKENMRRYDRNWRRRRTIKNMTAQQGAIGSMVAQMRKRHDD